MQKTIQRFLFVLFGFLLLAGTTPVKAQGPGGVGSATDYPHNILWFDAGNISPAPTDGATLTDWNDVSLNANAHNASSGNATYRASAINGNPAVEFSGGTSRFLIDAHDDINLATSYAEKTFALVFKTGSDVQTQQYLYEQGGSSKGMAVYIENQTLYLGLWSNNGDDRYFVNTQIQANTVYTAILVYENATISGYLNSTLLGSVSGLAAFETHNNPPGLGGVNEDSWDNDGNNPGDGNSFNGLLAEMVSYNHALSGADIETLFDHYQTKYGATPEPTAWGYGPGGIGTTDGNSTLKAWLDAGYGTFQQNDGTSEAATDGDLTGYWTDRSGSANHATHDGVITGQKPVFNSSVINGKPALHFNHTDSENDRNYLHIPGLTLDDNASVFIVATHSQQTNNNGSSFRVLFTTSDGGFWNDKNCHILSLKAQDRDPGYFNGFPGGDQNETAFAYDGTTHLYSTVTTSGNGESYIDGTNFGSTANVSSPYDAGYLIGACSGNDDRTYNGDMAEVIAFTSGVSQTQRIIIENYLQAKYNIASIANDFYSETSYPQDLIGIGLGHTASAGAGLLLKSRNFSVGEGEYLMAAHNGGDLTSTMLAGSLQGWERQWYFEKTGEIDAKIMFDLAQAGETYDASNTYNLIYRASTSDDFAIVPVSVVHEGDDIISFSLNSSELNSGYYTLGGEVACGTPQNLTTSNIQANSATLDWSDVTECVETVLSYEVQYREKEGTWTATTPATTATSSLELSGLTQDKIYEWKVRSNCTNSISSAYSDSVEFNTFVGTCNMPTDLNVTDIDYTTATLNWSGTPTAHFVVAYKRVKDETWTESETTDNSLALTDLMQGMKYHFKVRNVCVADPLIATDFTDPVEFTTLFDGLENGKLVIDTERLLPEGLDVDTLVITATGIANLDGTVTVNDEFTIQKHGVLNCGENLLTGTANLTTQDSAVIKGATNYNENISLSGNENYTELGIYHFNGTTLQDVSAMPYDALVVVVDNPEGISKAGGYRIHGGLEIMQGRVDCGGSRIKFKEEYQYIENHGDGLNHFSLRVERNQAVVEIKGSSKFFLNYIDTQAKNVNLLLSNDLHLAGGGRWEKASHITLNGNMLHLSTGFSGFNGYGDPWYFDASAGGTLRQDFNSTNKERKYPFFLGNNDISADKLKLKLNSGDLGDTAYIAVHYSPEAHPQTVGAVTTNYMDSYYEIEVHDIENVNYDLELFYDESDIVGDENQYEVFMYYDDTWNETPATAIAAANQIVWSGIDTTGVIVAGEYLGLDIFPCEPPQDLKTNNITINSAQANWAAPKGVASYTLAYKHQSEGTWTEVAGIEDNFYTIGSLASNSTYQWKVKTDCEGSDYEDISGYSQTVEFTTQQDNGCQAPINLSVDMLADQTAEISWGEIDNAENYIVQYWLDDGGTPSIESTTLSTNTASLNVQNENYYQFTISTQCAAGLNSPGTSDTVRFLTFIEGYDEPTNTLYITTERNVPTIKTFDYIYVQDEGIATLTQNIEVNETVVVEYGGYLKCDQHLLFSNKFELRDGGKLGIGSPDGIDSYQEEGNIRSFERIYSSNAHYVYNGSSLQDMGTGRPSSFATLTIDNPFGAKPYKYNSYFNGRLIIKQGSLANNGGKIYFGGELHIENQTQNTDVLDAQLQCSNNGGKVYLEGNQIYLKKLHFDKTGQLFLKQDAIIKSVSSYNGGRGYVYPNGYKIIMTPDGGIDVAQVIMDNNARIVQQIDNSSVGNTYNYRDVYDEGNNKVPFTFTLNSATLGTASEFIFQTIDRSHPERGGALNFINRYLKIDTTDIADFDYNVAMSYVDNDIVGDITLCQAGLYHDAAWDYNNATVVTGDNEVVLSNATTTGDLSAGFDFSLPAQDCIAPEGLSVSNIDYQGAVLQWGAVTDGVDQYIVRYRPVGSTDDDWLLLEAGNSLDYTLSDVMYDTEFEWQVQTVCQPGYYAESDFSGVSTFQTDPLKDCNPPQTLISADSTESTVELAWNAVEGQTGFVLQYKETDALGWNTMITGNYNELFVNQLTPETGYIWRIKSQCQPGYYEQSAYSVTDDFSTTPPCDTATNIRVEDIYYYGAELHWTPAANATSHTVKYSEMESGVWTEDASLAGEATSLFLYEELAPVTEYTWRIRSFCDNGGISPFSDSTQFTTTEEPICAIATGFQTTNISTSTATLNWASGESTAAEDSFTVAYRIQGDEEWTYASGITGNSLELDALPQGTTYEWKVRTECDGTGYAWDASDYSEIQTFKTYMVCAEVPQNPSSEAPNWCYIKLDWDAVFGITNYIVRFKPTTVEDWVEKAVGDRDSAIIYSLEGDTEYEWQVKTYCFGTETYSDWSVRDTVTTQINDGSACGGPTNDPYAEKYGTSPDWVANLPWNNIVNIQSFDDGSGYWDQALMDAQSSIYPDPGVIYFPAGTYEFQDHVQLLDGMILRGETPIETNAKDAAFAPPSRLIFPKYEPVLEGEGTPNYTAFKSITSPSLRSNTGLVYLDINRAQINFKVPLVDMPGYSTPQPVGEKTNVLIFGCRSNNVATPSPDVPAVYMEDGVEVARQHAWQRFSYRFGVNISVYVTANGIITNNRVNDFENNETHPVENDSYDQPGYFLAGTYQGSVEMPGGASGDGFTTIQYGERARFDYANHYGIELNRGKPYQTYGTEAVEPSLYATGMEANDNWIYSTRRVGIMASGDGLVIRGNMKLDNPDKRNFLSVVGTKLNNNNSATLEHRGIDFSGRNVTVDNNYLEVYNAAMMYSGYLSVDGEGILIQECCGGSPVDGAYITNNKVVSTNGYIGIYKMRDVKNVYIANNDMTEAACQQFPYSIYVAANTNGGDYRADNVRIENNKAGNNDIGLFASVGSCNAYVINNTGTGNVNAPCEAIVYNNTGMTVVNSECPPESTCEEMNNAPTITGFDPTEGAAHYPVEIYGTMLNHTDSIFFNQTKVTDFEIVDETTVKTTVPAGATTGKITIYTNTGYWETDHFVFPASAQSADDFVIGEGVEALTIDPAGGNYDAQQTVSITTPTDGATIYYTTDGTEPEEGTGTSQQYTDPVSVGENMTIKAKAFKTGMYPSLVAEESYVIQLIEESFASTSPVELGNPMAFYNTSTLSTGNFAQVQWDFESDGTFDAVGDTVEHTYTTAGYHDVTLKVTTNLGFTRSITQQVEITDHSSIRDVGQAFDNLRIYPNPTSNHLHIEINSPENGEVQIKVLDALGRVVKLQSFDKFGETVTRQISVEDLKPGVYMLEIQQEKYKAVKRIMKN